MIDVAGHGCGRVSAVRDPLLPIVGAMLTVALGVGCAKAQPDIEPALPPLAAPIGSGRGLKLRDAMARTESPRQEPEPKPAELPRAEGPVEGQRPAEGAAGSAPAPVLHLAPTAESAANERTIRDQLVRAAKDLSHVDYVALSADAKAQYDTAKRFMVLADEAIKDRNFVFARTLADKAAVIAGVLSNR